jgi:hypothetical protein
MLQRLTLVEGGLTVWIKISRGQHEQKARTHQKDTFVLVSALRCEQEYMNLMCSLQCTAPAGDIMGQHQRVRALLCDVEIQLLAAAENGNHTRFRMLWIM